MLTGGDGVDRHLGGAGSDVIISRSNTRDVVDCGSGRDTAFVDRRDSVKNCETIKRRS